MLLKTAVITCLTRGTQKTAQVAAAKRAVEEGGREEVHHCLILLMIPNYWGRSHGRANDNSCKLAQMPDGNA